MINGVCDTHQASGDDAISVFDTHQASGDYVLSVLDHVLVLNVHILSRYIAGSLTWGR